MARVQILHLPGKVLPDGTVEPQFALIVDQCTPARPVRYVTGTAESPEHERQWQTIVADHNRRVSSDPTGQPWSLEIDVERQRWEAFAEQIGARGVLFTADRVDQPVEPDSDEQPAGHPGAVTHYYHFMPPTLDFPALQRFVEREEKRRRGER